MNWPWEVGLGFEYHDFSYGDRERWTDQLWFDDNNFWLEQGEHEVTVDRLVMLGGDDVVTWRPHGKWMFHEDRKATVAYSGTLNSTDVGRKPKYWENLFRFHVGVHGFGCSHLVVAPPRISATLHAHPRLRCPLEAKSLRMESQAGAKNWAGLPHVLPHPHLGSRRSVTPGFAVTKPDCGCRTKPTALACWEGDTA